MSLGLVRYDAMCTAIAECYSVDEVKELRDKAKALEVYAQQAKNTDAERKACEIRIRAERRAGQILKEMKDRGERQKPGEKGPTDGRGARQTVSASKPSLPDLGITRDQSSKWQQLANVPAKQFEEILAEPGPKPSTEGIINAERLKKEPQPQMDPDSLWLWGRLRDFERANIFRRDPDSVIAAMTESMRADVERILPALQSWIERIGESDDEFRRTA